MSRLLPSTSTLPSKSVRLALLVLLCVSCADETSYVPAALEAGGAENVSPTTGSRRLTELADPGKPEEAHGAAIPSQDEADAMARGAINETNFTQELNRLEAEIRIGSRR